MAKWLIEFYEDLGDEMPGPYRAITVDADDEERARWIAAGLHNISKFKKCTDLDAADDRVKGSYYENERNLINNGPYNGD